MLVLVVGRLLIDIYSYLQVYEDVSLSRIHAPFQYSYGSDGACINGALVGEPVFQ